MITIERCDGWPNELNSRKQFAWVISSVVPCYKRMCRLAHHNILFYFSLFGFLSFDDKLNRWFYQKQDKGSSMPMSDDANS